MLWGVFSVRVPSGELLDTLNVATGCRLLVAENWYPDWQATAGGEQVPVLRGNHTMITVPVAAGVSEIELRFDSKPYRIGKVVTLISILVSLAAIVAPVVSRRRASD